MLTDAQKSRVSAYFFSALTSLAIILYLVGLGQTKADETDANAIAGVLDDFHTAASVADWERYFDLMTEDAIFIGTDAAERWDKPTFRSYAQKARNGWTYAVRSRNIHIGPDGTTAWFYELLDNSKYGTSRGTGVLIRGVSGWKIAQYHLTFPLPNDLAAEITAKIKAFEAMQSTP